MMDEVKIKGWIARDDGGMAFLYTHKPKRNNGSFEVFNDRLLIDPDRFPKLTYRNSPVEVEITITPKQRN